MDKLRLGYDDFLKKVCPEDFREKVQEALRQYAAEMGLSDDEIEIEIDPYNGTARLTAMPAVPSEIISFSLEMDGNEEGGNGKRSGL